MKKIFVEDPTYLGWIIKSDFSEQVKNMVKGILNGDFPRGEVNGR